MTTFTIGFDFTSAADRAVLKELQSANYNLVAFKGATGGQPIAAGVPAWFVVPFGHMFGSPEISYEPQYKVYIDSRSVIAAQTTINMEVLSAAVDLGSSLTFDQTGEFATGDSPNVAPGAIAVTNNQESGSPAVTIGLAGLVTTPAGTQYLPFCAFTLPPGGSIEMSPIEQVLIMAAQLDLQSGNVQAHLAAPGCMFSFDSSNTSYKLEIEDSTFAIDGAPGGGPVTEVASSQSVSLVNTLH